MGKENKMNKKQPALIKRYHYIEEWGDNTLRKCDRVIRQLRRLLRHYSMGLIPSPNYTVDELKGLCISLLESQRDDVENLYGMKPYSWCITPDAKGMPGDARVYYAFTPTYLAVSILTKFLVDYPEIAKEIPNYETQLKRGMVFASYRKLQGHGYEGEHSLYDTIRLFKMAKVADFLAENPDFCPELLETLREVKAFFANSRYESRGYAEPLNKVQVADILRVLGRV